MENSDGKITGTGRVHRLDELAQDVHPARDLWPAIAAAIEAQPGSPASAARRVTYWPRHWMTWAACASLAGVVVGVFWMRDGANHQGGAGLAAVEAALIVDPGYVTERAALVADVPARIAALPAEAQAGAQEGLAAIRRSESELQEAIRSDPGDSLLLEMLIATRQEEMRVMTNIQRTENEERML